MRKVLLVMLVLGLALSACSADRSNPEGTNDGAPGMKPTGAEASEPVQTHGPRPTRGPIPTLAPTVTAGARPTCVAPATTTASTPGAEATVTPLPQE